MSIGALLDEKLQKGSTYMLEKHKTDKLSALGALMVKVWGVSVLAGKLSQGPTCQKKMHAISKVGCILLQKNQIVGTTNWILVQDIQRC